MDKETILKKARNEKDEMVVRTCDRAMRYTYIALVLCAAVFAFIRGMNDQPVMDLCATVCFSVFAGQTYCFVRMKDKFHLIMAIVALIIAIAATVRFFMGH